MGCRWPTQHGAVAALLILLGSASASALDATEAKGRAQVGIQSVEAALPRLSTGANSLTKARASAEKQIASGELSLRTRDYERAIQVFNQLCELHSQGKIQATSHADALFLLAESYFESEQLLSARRRYQELIRLAKHSSYLKYSGKALGRLVDIALRTGDLRDLDFVFEQLPQLPNDKQGAVAYAKAKALYAKQDFKAAEVACRQVPQGSEYHHQAQYLLGVVYMRRETSLDPGKPVAAAGGKEQRYAAAISQFQRVTQLPADSDDHRHVIDLAWLALGRLLYESENYLDAAESYSHIERSSVEFNTMLYELAWVYIRIGDYQRAQRALEVLTVAAPETLDLADGSLLRADLMLRSGRFDNALTLYEGVKERFDPVKKQVDDFLGNTRDPAVYYDRLVDHEFLQHNSKVPKLVLQWVREAAEDDRVFAVIDDVTRSRDLVQRSRRLAKKLHSVLDSGTRAQAFPELKARLEEALGLVNRLAVADLDLARGLDDQSDDNLRGEIAQVAKERRALMKRMGALPVTVGDFLRREEAAKRKWTKLSQKLQRLTLEADRIQAIVNGLRRVLQEADRHGVTKDGASRARFQAEIEANERDLGIYRSRIADFLGSVDAGRVQVGFGDQSYARDHKARERFAKLVRREMALAAAGQAGPDAAEYARQATPMLERSDRAGSALDGVMRGLEAHLGESASELRAVVVQETTNIERYSNQLDAMDQHARLLVGQVAKQNFVLVRDRLKSIVLRADVGIVQQAWELREEQRERLRNLQRERALEQQNLNDELREVLDDTEDAL